jgi:hypothetical protein
MISGLCWPTRDTHETGQEIGQETSIMQSLTLLVLTIINYNNNDVEVDVDVFGAC